MIYISKQLQLPDYKAARYILTLKTQTPISKQCIFHNNTYRKREMLHAILRASTEIEKMTYTIFENIKKKT